MGGFFMLRKKTMTEKYINHESGVPIRIPPYLRQEIRLKDPLAKIQVDMIRKDARVGIRGAKDTLPYNMQENIRLRKIARSASAELIEVAEHLGVKRYATIVHGSLSRGVIRHPSDTDPSDVDITLIIDGLSLDREERRDIAKPMMRDSFSKYGVKTDVHIWTLDQTMTHSAELARTYLQSAAYPIANTEQLWEQVRWVGLTCHTLLQQGQKVRQLVRALIPAISEGDIEGVNKYLLLRRNGVNLQTYQYLSTAGLLDTQYGQIRAQTLLPAIIENHENDQAVDAA